MADLLDEGDVYSCALLDPCAGEGAAILSLGALIGTRKDYYTCEMEQERYAALKKNLHEQHEYSSVKDALHGDAFQIDIPINRMSVLYLNPPYDIDPQHGRLEQRFLDRFTQTLVEGGVLLFVVPYYALKASITTLATQYSDLLCFRFPDEDFEAYRQVVLIARKSEELPGPNPEIVEQVTVWSNSADALPVLGTTLAKYRIPEKGYSGADSTKWSLREMDLVGLVRKARPWKQSGRSGVLLNVPHILPEVPVEDLMFRTFPLATSPRPAHIAAGIASGLFNGRRVTAQTSGMPDLLVKGVFDREYVTIEEKHNKDGEVSSVVQVQQPKLVTTVLNLRTQEYTTLQLGAATDSREVSEMSIEDLLNHYGPSLMRVMAQQCPVSYDPKRDSASLPLAPIQRPLYRAQENAAKAIVQLLGGVKAKQTGRQTQRAARQGKTAILLGEIGSGKCLGLGTLVLKYDGTSIPVEHIQKGDMLMGPDSKPRRVLGTTRGTGELYKIVPQVGEPWICNDAHILTLVHTMSDEVFDIPLQTYIATKRLAMRLKKGNRTTHPAVEFKQFFPEGGVDFPPQIPPIVNPYFLGLWYGDGNKADAKGRLNSVAITNLDQPIIDFVYAMAEEFGLKVNKSPSNRRCPTYSLSTGKIGGLPNPLLDRMRIVYGDRTRLPKSCLLGDRATREYFLAGLLDSDGSLDRGVYDFSQKVKSWSEDVCFLARSLGFRATMSRSIKADQNGTRGEYWRVCLSGDFSRIPVRLPRKKAKPRVLLRKNKLSDPNSGYRRVRKVNRTSIKVQPIGVGDYAGFELDGDGRFLLGDFTVTHNTSVAISVGRTIAKRVLVMCPPHLLDEWRGQVQAVSPEAEFRVLQNVTDVDALRDVPADKFLVAVVSRETAKLGHGWQSVTGQCPKCGGTLPLGDLAKKRARCEHQTLRSLNQLARAAQALALRIAPSSPMDPRVQHVLNGRFVRHYLKRFEEAPLPWRGLSPGFVDGILDEVVARALDEGEERACKLAGRLLAAELNPERIARVVRSIKADTSYYLRDFAKALVLLLPTGSDLQNELCQADIFTKDPWGSFDSSLKVVSSHGLQTRIGELKLLNGVVCLNSKAPGSLEMALSLLNSLTGAARFSRSRECGEPLFQAIPEPRRFPLSQYICARHADVFDLLVLDEGHEYATDGSAQERSAHRLTALGIPTILMTGSIMNGYAESLFSNMWALSRDFRQEFERDEKGRFVERYGYLKRILTDRDRNSGEIVSFGSHTDRVERSERTAGNAPGILPLFLFRHLLPLAVTLHKADLAIDLPPCKQIRCTIEPDADLLKSFKSLQQSLITRIRKDQFVPGLAGKLFGALAELPSYLDRATVDTGNQDDGSYEIRYPDAIGGELVAKGESFPVSRLSAKERWMLDTLRAELAEGRNVLVFSWHISLLPRLARILSQELGEEVPILYAEKVATQKRLEWINKNVVRKNRRIMIANPVAIQTGLNNLVHFSSEIWMENPACNPTIFRQATGRVDRIGAKKETRIYTPVFGGTLQVQLLELLLRKVAVATATDGLDPESMLLAAGASDDRFLSGLSIGKQLWNMLNAN
jgi:predicted RNA methylase